MAVTQPDCLPSLPSKPLQLKPPFLCLPIPSSSPPLDPPGFRPVCSTGRLLRACTTLVTHLQAALPRQALARPCGRHARAHAAQDDQRTLGSAVGANWGDAAASAHATDTPLGFRAGRPSGSSSEHAQHRGTRAWQESGRYIGIIWIWLGEVGRDPRDRRGVASGSEGLDARCA